MNPNLPQAGKKPYSTPIIKIYGDIRVITQSITKTHPTGDGGTLGSSVRT